MVNGLVDLFGALGSDPEVQHDLVAFSLALQQSQLVGLLGGVQLLTGVSLHLFHEDSALGNRLLQLDALSQSGASRFGLGFLRNILGVHSHSHVLTVALNSILVICDWDRLVLSCLVLFLALWGQGPLTLLEERKLLSANAIVDYSICSLVLQRLHLLPPRLQLAPSLQVAYLLAVEVRVGPLLT